MVQNFNVNQFSPQPLKGDLPYSNNVVIECQILSTSTESFLGGTAVKLVSGTKGGLPVVEKITDNSFGNGNVYGFIKVNKKKGTQVASDIVSVAIMTSVMYMEAGGNITGGNLLSYDFTTQTVSHLTTSGNHGIGFALTNGVSGDIIKVLITTPNRNLVD